VDGTGRVALAANYHLGQAAAIRLNSNGTFGAPRVVTHSGHGPDPTAQTGPHVHSSNIARDGRFALVCDLGLDRIYTYAIGREPVALLPVSPPFMPTAPGAGPRHLAFGGDGTRAYAVNELDSTVAFYRYDPGSGALAHVQTIGVLPKGYAGKSAAAEVCLHPNGRFLYCSCRGPDILAVYTIDGDSGRLEPLESVPCGGMGPRSFSVSPDGRWLVCAHQVSGTLCSFAIEPESGRLKRIPGTIAVSMPVCVVFVN
jgi:6-phosphogluconolactonase